MAHSQVAKALTKLDHISRDPALVTDWPDAIDQLLVLAQNTGLSTKHINQGWDIALSGRINTQSATALLSTLLPRHPMGPAPVLRIVSVLGEHSHNKPKNKGQIDYRLQRAALERLSLLLEAGAVSQEGRDALGAMWEVLARALEYGTLRESAGTVLCQITRRKHVQEHRIRHVRSLIASLDAPPASCHRLLSIFHSYCPELVPNYAPTRTGGRELRGKKLELVAQVRALLRDPNEAESDGREAKRRKIGEAHIPSAATHSASTSSIPLCDITSLAELAQRMPTLELPSQAGAVFGFVPGSAEPSQDSDAGTESDRAKAWAVVLACGFGSDPRYVRRIDSFIETQLRHELCELDDSPAVQARVNDLLTRVCELSRLGGEVPASVEHFLASFLSTWDGATHQRVVFDLVALFKPTQFSVFYETILSPLQKLAVSAEADWLADWLECVSGLVQTLGIRDDWFPGEDDPADPYTAWSRLNSEVNYHESLELLLEFADSAAQAALEVYPESVALRSSALGFYETSLTLSLASSVPVVVVPSAPFAYSCLVADEVASVSRICGVIAKLREALTSEDTAIERETAENVKMVQKLNEFLIDFISLLWQKKLLSEDGEDAAKAQFGLTSEQVEAVRSSMEQREQVLGPALGLTVHPALALLAKKCLDSLEDRDAVEPALRNPGVPVLASTLKDLASEGGIRMSFTEFRAQFLDWLGEAGANGVGEFLESSLQSLIKRKEGKVEAA